MWNLHYKQFSDEYTQVHKCILHLLWKPQQYNDSSVYLDGGLLDQKTGWVASDLGCSAGMSHWEDLGGRWKSKARTGPRGRAGEGKDQQTWNISD